MQAGSDTATRTDSAAPSAPGRDDGRNDGPTGAPSRRRRFESVLQSAWYRAKKRGFAPGEEREAQLEAEFKRLRGRDR